MSRFLFIRCPGGRVSGRQFTSEVASCRDHKVKLDMSDVIA